MPDVIVIGGGVMGLAAAREIRKRGLAVTLLERGQTGRAASWASAGIVGAPTGPSNEPGHRLQSLSRRLWPGFAAQLREESGLDPEFRETGCLIPALTADDAADLDRSIRHGLIEQGRLLTGAEAREIEPGLSPAAIAAAWRPAGNVENRRLCKALELVDRQLGVEIRTGAEVRSIVYAKDRAAGVELVDGTLAADQVVVAAGAWSGSLPGCRPALPVVPQRGQILALDRGSVAVNHVVMAPDDPYLVPRADGRIVIGATREMAGWDASTTAGGIGWLLASAIQLVPALAQCVVHEIWTGFRPLSRDGVPFIGQGAAEGLYVVTGHGPSGIGPMPGTIALLVALMFGEAPPLDPTPFDPLRFAS